MAAGDDEILSGLCEEAGLTRDEARFYLGMLEGDRVPASKKDARLQKLLAKGMVILAGDDSEFIPVHPRLAVANQYRTWREQAVREINERRMRVDKLIIRLIPLYEATTEKRLSRRRS